MNVSELIAKLELLPQDAIVIVPSHHGTGRGEYTPADDGIDIVQYIQCYHATGDIVYEQQSRELNIDFEPNAVVIHPTDD